MTLWFNSNIDHEIDESFKTIILFNYIKFYKK